VLGKQVFVTGCGPIGSLLIGALRRAGAARIVAADIADLPLKCAKEMGADETINLKTQAELLDKYKVDKGQFEAVFEASGSEPALRAALDVIMPRGILVSVGMGGDMSIPMTQLVAKEVDLRGTFRFHAEFANGGIAQGPRAGFPALLHGTEAVVPLPDGKTIPVRNDGNTEMINAIKDLKNSMNPAPNMSDQSVVAVLQDILRAQRDQGDTLGKILLNARA
jgi:NADPH:quinone reductase-like Zn-dependent oxidoreductase